MSAMFNTVFMLAAVTYTLMVSLPGGHSFSLPFIFVNCTGGIKEQDETFATTNGMGDETIELKGTMHLFHDKNSPAQWLYYNGEFDVQVDNKTLNNMQNIKQIIFDFSYKLDGKTVCVRLAL